MKYPHVFLCALALLALLVCLDSYAYTQAVKNPEKDLTVSFSAQPEGTGRPFEYIKGEVRNESANNYPCVVLAFHLKNIAGKYVGVASTEVRGMSAGAKRPYRANISIPDVGTVWFKSTTECTGPLPPIGTCTIKVSISEDKDEHETAVYLYSEGSRKMTAQRLSLQQYKFVLVPEGNYTVKPEGKYPRGDGRGGGLAPKPPEKRVQCQPGATHSVSFKIDSTEG